MSPTVDDNAFECVRLSPKWKNALARFFHDLAENGDTWSFMPHPTDDESLERVANYAGRDLYYVLVQRESVLGYGLLRGWDEGYEIPSLGVAIHPTARNRGLGRLLMHFMHMLTVWRGATKVRLRVHQDNKKAKRLYESLGYVFVEKSMDDGEYMIGIKDLTRTEH